MMIITCPCEKKKFEIDSSLIPAEGRELQCGSCSRVWFFKKKNQSSRPLNLSKNFNLKTNNKEISEKTIDTPDFDIDLKQENTENIDDTQKLDQTEKKKDKQIEKENKFFSYLFVFFISLIALVTLLDTLKTPLISIFPALEIVLFNLFETLKDIKLFIIDLS